MAPISCIERALASVHGVAGTRSKRRSTVQGSHRAGRRRLRAAARRPALAASAQAARPAYRELPRALRLFGLAGARRVRPRLRGRRSGRAARRRARPPALARVHGDRRIHAAARHRDAPACSSRSEHAGFKVAISVGLLVSAVFARGSAFVDLRPDLGAVADPQPRLLPRAASSLSMAALVRLTVPDLPPLDGPHIEAARGSLLAVFAFVGSLVYAVSAARYWQLFRTTGSSCRRRRPPASSSWPRR